MVKNKGLIAKAYEWDEEEVSSDDNEIAKIKVLMALAEDNEAVSKEGTKNGIWVKISMRKIILGVDQLTEDPSSSEKKDLVFVKSFANDTKVSIAGGERPWLSEAEGFILPDHDTSRILPIESQRNTTDPLVSITESSTTDYDSIDESSICSTLLPPLKKLDAPIRGDKSSSASKVNSAPVECDIKKPIWYLDSRCSRHMTGVKSYLHKYVEQPGPKVVFEDNSTCTTKGYGSVNCNVDNIDIVESERYPPDEYLYPYKPSQRNKRDKTGVVIRNKAILVAQCYNQQESIDYDETFAPVARLEAIRIFLAFDIYMNFIFYQIDVKVHSSMYDINGSSVKTPMVPPNKLGPDLIGKAVNETQYRGMIGSQMYLTKSRPDIQFLTCPCARYQANLKESRLIFVKRMFRRKQSLKYISKSKTEASKSKTSQSDKETQPSLAKDKSLSHPLTSTPMVGEMHKEAHQVASGPTSLGATSEEGANPQLSSADSTTEANSGISAPNDFIPEQKDQAKSIRNELKTAHTDLGTNKESRSDEISKKIKLEDLSNLMQDTRSTFLTPNTLYNYPINVLDVGEVEETKRYEDTHATSLDGPEDTSIPHLPSPKSVQIQITLVSEERVRATKSKG
nr:hypothetical protein [Tanacetum cinerariifolium]